MSEIVEEKIFICKIKNVLFVPNLKRNLFLIMLLVIGVKFEIRKIKCRQSVKSVMAYICSRFT